MSKFEISANVYAIKLGPQFGRTVRTTIEAPNDKVANREGQFNFQRYVNALEHHHNNGFSFNNFNVKEI